MLCATCRGAIQHLYNLTFISDDPEIKILGVCHHPTLDDLLFSVRLGCWLCVKFWDYVGPERQARAIADRSLYISPEGSLPSRERDDKDARYYRSKTMAEWCTNMLIQDAQPYSNLWKNGKPPEFKLVVLVHFGKRRKNEDEICVIALQTVTDLIESPVRSLTTASDETWNFLRHWIDVCSSSHSLCNQHEDWQPTRLLEIDGETIKLTTGNSRYLSLSHRWGTGNPLKLANSTIDMLTTGINIDRLTPCFKDAIGICKRLNIPYIWIDSLCIKQDDPEDWRREAALMHKVYSNAFLNISSLAAADGSSFYITRPALQFDERITSRLQVLEDKLGFGDEQTYRLVDSRLWDDEVERSALNRRGWVLQERLLSPRIISFGHHQAFFECREAKVAEANPAGLSTDNTFLTEALGLQDMISLSETSTFRTFWSKVVATYSICILSFSADRMIALAGIASQLATVFNDDYIAGMWRSSLAGEICWTRRDYQRPGVVGIPRRPIHYRAPSFSWLSLDWPVNAASLHKSHAICEVIEVHIDTDNPFTGPVRGGHILLRGRLQKLYMPLHWHVGFAEEGSLALRINGRLIRKDDDVGGPRITLDVHSDQFNANGKQNLFCMPACQYDDGNLVLLLLECQDYAAGVFSRFGVASTRKEEERSIIHAAYEAELAYPCVSFDGKHTIKLV